MPKGPSSEPVRPFCDAVTAGKWLLLAVHCVGVPHELFTRRVGSMGREYLAADYARRADEEHRLRMRRLRLECRELRLNIRRDQWRSE